MGDTRRLAAALLALDDAVRAFNAKEIHIEVRNTAMAGASAAGATAQQIAAATGLKKRQVWAILHEQERSVPDDGHEAP